MMETVLQLMVAGIMGVERALPVVLMLVGALTALGAASLLGLHPLMSTAASLAGLSIFVGALLFASRNDGKRRG